MTANDQDLNIFAHVKQIEKFTKKLVLKCFVLCAEGGKGQERQKREVNETISMFSSGNEEKVHYDEIVRDKHCSD